MNENQDIKNTLLRLKTIANNGTSHGADDLAFLENCLSDVRLVRFFLSVTSTADWTAQLQSFSDFDFFGGDLESASISYLLRVYEESPEELAHTLEGHFERLSRHSLFRILSFANEQKPLTAAQFITAATILTQEPDDIFGSTLSEFIAHISTEDEPWPQAQQILFDILSFELNQTKGYDDFEPKLDNHTFEEFMSKGLLEVATASPSETFDLVISTLNNLIQLKIDKGHKFPASLDEIHCVRVETTSAGYADPEEILVIGLTNVALGILETSPQLAQKVVQALDDADWDRQKGVKREWR